MHLQPLLPSSCLFWQSILDFWMVLEPFFLLSLYLSLSLSCSVVCLFCISCRLLLMLAQVFLAVLRLLSWRCDFNTVFNLHSLQGHCFMRRWRSVERIALNRIEPPCHYGSRHLWFGLLHFTCILHHFAVGCARLCSNFGPVWICLTNDLTNDLTLFDEFFHVLSISAASYCLVSVGRVSSPMSWCLHHLEGAKGAPPPSSKGGLDHRIRLGLCWLCWLWMCSPGMKWCHHGGFLWNKRNKRNNEKHEGSPTVARQSSDSRPTVQGIRHKSGTMVFSNAAYRCYVPWQFNAA